MTTALAPWNRSDAPICDARGNCHHGHETTGTARIVSFGDASVREARDTEALRDSMADLREDLRAGKITNKEARAITKEANKILQQVRARL
jgi:hypothetical protein